MLPYSWNLFNMEMNVDLMEMFRQIIFLTLHVSMFLARSDFEYVLILTVVFAGAQAV